MIRTKLRSKYKKSIYKEGIIKTDQENAKVLNNSFSNIQKSWYSIIQSSESKMSECKGPCD